jgi:hypothetical protein
MTDELLWVETPTDFGETLGTEYGSFPTILGAPKPELEQELRAILTNIFSDIQYVEAQDLNEKFAFLDGIEEPLRRLRELGFVLLVHISNNKRQINGKPFHYRIAHYYVTIDIAIFGIDQGHVHLVTRKLCPQFKSEFLEARDSNREIRAWFDPSVMHSFYAERIPWCTDCFEQEARRAKGTVAMFNYSDPDLEAMPFS